MSLGRYIHYILTLLTLFEKRSKQLRIVNSMLGFFFRYLRQPYFEFERS